jgi:Centrosomin N-terminal motif 1
MSSPADDAMKETVSRLLAKSSGYSVKQTEEVIRILRKENFNLKLKLFLLENRSSNARPSTAPSGNDVGDKEFYDLFAENEAMRNELDEKHSLLKAALDVIHVLEDGKLKSEEQCRDMMIEQRDSPKVNKASSELFQLNETLNVSG